MAGHRAARLGTTAPAHQELSRTPVAPRSPSTTAGGEEVGGVNQMGRYRISTTNGIDSDGEPRGTSGCRQGPLGRAQQGDSTGHGGCRSSFLGHPTRPFSRGRARHPAIGRFAPSRGAPASPSPRVSDSSDHSPKCHPCSRLTLLPMLPVAQVQAASSGPCLPR